MRTRTLPWVALLGLTLWPAVARPDEAAAAKPAFFIRLAPFDTLIEDLRYLGELVGKEGEASSFESILKGLIGKKGLEGIDTKKPIGAYGTIGAFGLDSTAVVLVPIADEQAFLGLVEKLTDGKPEKGGDGVYTANLERVAFPIYLRFADKYCHITVRDKDALAKDRLLAPAAVFPPGKVGTLGITLNIDRIPDGLKQKALGPINLRLASIKEKQEKNETPAQSRLKAAILDDVSLRIKSLLREGGAVNLRVDLDRSANDLAVSMSLAGKPNSGLATHIADLGKLKSLGAALVGRDSGLGALIDLSLPAKVRDAAGPVIDELEKKALDEAKGNKVKRDLLATILNAVKPTVKAGQVDAGLDLRGPNAQGIYTGVAGIKVKDGGAIDKSLHKIVTDLPAEAREMITLDFDKVDNATIHRLKSHGPVNPDIPLGDTVFVAVRDDLLLIAAGDKALEALKGVLGTSTKASPVARVELSLSHLAPLMEKENKGAVEAAKKVFTAAGSDKVRITVEGGPVLQLRLDAKALVVKFLSMIDNGR